MVKVGNDPIRRSFVPIEPASRKQLPDVRRQMRKDEDESLLVCQLPRLGKTERRGRIDSAYTPEIEDDKAQRRERTVFGPLANVVEQAVRCAEENEALKFQDVNLFAFFPQEPLVSERTVHIALLFHASQSV